MITHTQPQARIQRLCHLLGACIIVASASAGAADEGSGANPAVPADTASNEFRVPRPARPAAATTTGAILNDHGTASLTKFEQNYNGLRTDARADLARIISPSKLLTADFQAIYDQEKSLEKEARKMTVTAQENDGDQTSIRVGRYGAHVIAFNKCLQNGSRCDTLYSAYLDACASHFKRYHQSDLELQMRHAPCGCDVLAVMGEDYARLHHAVLQAHAERLKLLALENTLRGQSGIQQSASDQRVKGQILPTENASH